jgi:hypothetical protein
MDKWRRTYFSRNEVENLFIGKKINKNRSLWINGFAEN